MLCPSVLGSHAPALPPQPSLPPGLPGPVPAGMLGVRSLLPGLLHLGCDPLTHQLRAEEGAPGGGTSMPRICWVQAPDGPCRLHGAQPPDLCRDRGGTGAPEA